MRRFRMKRLNGEPVDVGMIDLGRNPGDQAWVSRFFVDGAEVAESRYPSDSAAMVTDAIAGRFAHDREVLKKVGIILTDEVAQIEDDDL